MANVAAIVVMALFTGAAFYITFAEHPARLGLPESAALAQWKPSYRRGFAMQATLAVAGGVAGAWAYTQTGGWLNLTGALAALANWPFTLTFIMPVNRELLAAAPEQAGPRTRELLLRWGRLHACRTALGAASLACFLAA